VAAGLLLAVSVADVLALGSSTVGRPADGMLPPTSVAPVTAAISPAGGLDGDPRSSAITVALRVTRPLGVDDAAARPGGGGRPVVTLPEVAPRVVLRAPPGARVVVLGDSYTSGWNGAGLGRRNWTALVGSSRGWTVTNLAVAGTGYRNPGWTSQPVGSLVPRTIRLRPDVVILATGHNDSRWTAASTSAEAERVIARLRAGLPDAVIVLLAPIWQNGSPPTRCLVLRDHLRRTAAAVGAVFVDPLSGRWFAGSDHRFIGPDGLHPTDAGHRHIADELLSDLAGRLAT
jgi:lysophospholipase L1-like esterase